MNKETPAGELTDAQIMQAWYAAGHDCWSLENTVVTAARAIIAADRELRRGDVAMPVAAWLYDWGIEGTHEVVEDWATQSHAEAHSKADGCRNIRPLVKQSDAQAALAAKDATHEKQLNAHKSLIQSLENQRTTLQQEVDNALALWTVAHAERSEAMIHGAMLDAEITALKAERDALKVDAERLDWVALQDLSEFDIQFIFDAPHEGEYSVGTEYGTFYGLTLREAIDAARYSRMAKAVQP